MEIATTPEPYRDSGALAPAVNVLRATAILAGGSVRAAQGCAAVLPFRVAWPVSLDDAAR